MFRGLYAGVLIFAFCAKFLAAEDIAGPTIGFVSTENSIIDMQLTLDRIESGVSFVEQREGAFDVFGNSR
jgi:hypothetical protein